ncbi:MAG: VWA domain-containing protein [Firmicutes bacterium]|nr:VWA domain-containing protein [Bacillota bacterium]
MIKGDVELLGNYLASIFNRDHGARVGETAIISRKIHTIDPAAPDEVRVVVNADAGEIFYRRRDAGEVVHMDIFHEVGSVNHCLVAKVVREVFEADPRGRAIMDYVDVQTATGGGRITGSLNYGDKPSLRRAHLNHVHVAALLHDSALPLVFNVVAAVEAEISAQGYEIRKIQRLAHERGNKNGRADMSPYSSFSDSMIQGDGPKPGDSPFEHQSNLQKAMELSDDFGSVDEVAEVLEYLAEESDLHNLMAKLAQRNSTPSEMIDILVNKGLARRDGWKATLTPEGWKLRNFFRLHRQEIEMHFRRLIRRIPAISAPRDRITYTNSSSRKTGGRVRKKICHPDKDEWFLSIAVPETVVNAATRCLASRCTAPAGTAAVDAQARAAGEAVEQGFRITVAPEDLIVEKQLRSNPVDICLLIDASASMAGRRIHAAKYLARHLLLATRDKVAVVIFQESSVKVHVPFTRAYQKIELGVMRIQPLGLTPLAEGIIGCLEYVKAARVKNPLILMITDGIPTVPKWSLNPIDDALQAATTIPQMRVKFGCVGLEPNKSFLESLTKKAGGTLYIVDELEKDSLATIAHRERAKVTAGNA